MLVGIRSVLSVGKICIALLLGMISIAIAVPSGDVALGQRAATVGPEPPLFTAIDLHPAGWAFSYATGISGGTQVGYGGPEVGYGTSHALLWRGSTASMVDLNPTGFEQSRAWAASGGQQVGYGFGPATGGHGHALLWRGSAATVVDLHPRGFISSRALAVSGAEQAGSGLPQGAPLVGSREVPASHALLWHGSADSVVDLHEFLPQGFVTSFATGIDTAGNVVGSAEEDSCYAILWKRNTPKISDARKPGTTRCQFV